MRKSWIRRDWKDLYQAAIFEEDSSKVPHRIVEAESALAARALELSGADGDLAHEQKAMENARYFLRVLGSTAGMVNTSQRPPSQRAAI